MSSVSSKASLSLLDRAFLLSLVLGSAASYSIVYLFHLVLAAKLSRSGLLFLGGKSLYIPHAVRWDIAFFCFFMGWYGLSILWAENTAYALRYCAYVVLASLTVFYVISICDTLPRLQATFRFLAIAFSVEIFLAVLEGARIIRLPFSAFSPYQIYFGRQPNDLSELGETNLQYVLSMPTGFFGNSNNLSAFLILILPFFLLNRRNSIKLIGALSVMFVIYMAGARAAMIAYAVILVLILLLYASNVIRVAAVASLLVFGGLGAGVIDAMKDSEIKRIAEVGAIGVAVRDLVVGFMDDSGEQQMNSTGVRVQLILNGLDALRDSGGLGVGGGGSQTVQENSKNAIIGKVTAMHNFWVEILVEGGVGFAIVFSVWYSSLLWRLRRVARRSSDPTLRYFGKALFIGFLAFLLGAIGPSSVIYMLPMWLTVGLSLATINIERKCKRDFAI